MICSTGKESVGSVRKNRFQTVRVSFGAFEGRAYVYLHSFQQPEGVIDADAEERPGGMTLAPSVWRGLLPLIEQACDLADKGRGAGGFEDCRPYQNESVRDRRERIRGSWADANKG